MIKPDQITLRDGGDYTLINLFGIDFEIKEGSLENMKPLGEVSSNASIPLDSLKNILEKYGFLNKKGEIAKTECDVISYLPDKTEDFSELHYPFLALSNVLTPKKGTKLEDNDFKPRCIWGHEQFIVDLIKLSKGRNGEDKT